MILFLDLDGVLHAINGAPFTQREHLWQILRSVPSVSVVFTTSWWQWVSPAEIAGRATAGGGEDLASRFIGVTPMIVPFEKAHRQAEILAWLESQDRRHNFWLALDDEPTLFERNCPNLHACKASGLDAADVEAIVKRLREEALGDYARSAEKWRRKAEAADLCSNGAPHQWTYDGQTMLNTRWTCDVCGKTKLD